MNLSAFSLLLDLLVPGDQTHSVLQVDVSPDNIHQSKLKCDESVTWILRGTLLRHWPG